MFLMIAGTSSIWLFMLVPTYLFMLRPQADVEVAFYIWVFYSFATSFIIYVRFAMGKWRDKHLIEDENLAGDDIETGFTQWCVC